MNLPRPSSSGKLGAWTREGEQKVDDITSTPVTTSNIFTL